MGKHRLFSVLAWDFFRLGQQLDHLLSDPRIINTLARQLSVLPTRNRSHELLVMQYFERPLLQPAATLISWVLSIKPDLLTGLDRHFHLENRWRNYPTPTNAFNTTLGFGKFAFL